MQDTVSLQGFWHGLKGLILVPDILEKGKNYVYYS